jgi:two-component system, NarL family, nitrate/nitrite response regulator NarL
MLLSETSLFLTTQTDMASVHKSVFILEDQPDAITLLSRVVSKTFASAQVTVMRDLASAKTLNLRHIDLALIDLRLPDGLSIEWLAEFKQQHPETMAIVTSLYDDDELVIASMRAGADGYLLKGEGDEHLSRGLAKVLDGEPPISPAIARKLMQHFRSGALVNSPPSGTVPSNADSGTGGAMTKPSDSENQERLTPREVEVLGLIGAGLMIKQVAVKLNISYHTVNDNIKAIYRKLGIRTRAQAAAEAAKRGLLS